MPAWPVVQVCHTADQVPVKKTPTTDKVSELQRKTQIMKLNLRTILMLCMATLLSGCPQTKDKSDLSETLRQYESIIRWAQWDAAVNFIATEYKEEHPITRLEIERLRLFRVTKYVVRSSIPIDDGNGLVQVVEIYMFNKNQARERSIIDEQHWKYNKEIKRWLLHTGLPDPTQKNN
jgi:hypothetical protein